MPSSSEAARHETPLSVGTITVEADFEKLDKIYQDSFGESSVPTNVLRDWWKTAPSGLIALYRNADVVGGMSVWPITESTYRRFRTGTVRERDITPEDLSPMAESRHFYASEIAIRVDERKHIGSLVALFSGSIDLLISTRTFPLQILALGYSNEGENLMKKLGFHKLLDASKVSDQQPLFELVAHDKKQLQSIKNRFLRIAQALGNRR